MPTPPLRRSPRHWWRHVRHWLSAHHRQAPTTTHQPVTTPQCHPGSGGGDPDTPGASAAIAALVRKGWNVHSAPYGYLTTDVAGTRTASGRPRTRLTPDPRRAPVVQRIFHWRAITGLSVDQITTRLNNNTDRNPPPGTSDNWQPITVAGLLTNLKYTGYQTFNTRDDTGAFRPIDDWVLSDQPAHRALITPALFWAAQNPTTANRRTARHRLLAQPHHRAI